jgi:predicted RNase H-like HicB family nuclease
MRFSFDFFPSEKPELPVLSYPVRLAQTTEGKVRVIFLDVPEAVAEADTEAEALYRAKFALELSLGNYLLHDRSIPTPSDVPGAPVVTTDKFNSAEGTAGADEPAGEAETAPGAGRY